MFKSGKKKKTARTFDDVNNSNERHAANPELVTMFLNLQEKLNSPVFNGGFDRLFAKVEGIEASQRATAMMVESLNKLVYEPDDGLFSRIKRVEGVNVVELQKISNSQEKFKEDLEEMKVTLKGSVSTTSEVGELKTKVAELATWRSDLSRKLWILIPVILTLLGKIGWDVISAHVVVK
jgi:hypothetical protein